MTPYGYFSKQKKLLPTPPAKCVICLGCDQSDKEDIDFFKQHNEHSVLPYLRILK